MVLYHKFVNCMYESIILYNVFIIILRHGKINLTYNYYWCVTNVLTSQNVTSR